MSERSRRPRGRFGLEPIASAIVRCRQCPRLVEHCQAVARKKRRAFLDWSYWGKPVPGFGDPSARIWILGLAPAAHGANRTGRMFTGDRSGDFLYAALHRAGLANQATSTARDDGLLLEDVYISAAARCAPPDNHPTRAELESCAPFLDQESRALAGWRVLLCLGGIAWEAGLCLMEREGATIPKPRPRFAHGAEAHFAEKRLLSCYHVSQQNTFTGRLTPAMLDAVIARASQLAR